VIDEGNREGLRIEVGRSISSLRVTRIMSELVEFYGKPLAIRLDNGPELTAESFTEWAKEQGIELRFIQITPVSGRFRHHSIARKASIDAGFRNIAGPTQ
jgi:transposase InsO family protein